jgi:hypothetical protein
MVVYTDTFEDLLLNVEEVLRHLRDLGLTLKLAVYEISFLEHIVSPNGIRIDPERIWAVCIFPSWGCSLHWYGQFLPSVRPEFLGSGGDIKD